MHSVDVTAKSPLVCLLGLRVASYPGPFTLIAWEEKKGLISTVWMTSCFGMILRKMSSRLCTCHICSVEVAPKHSTAWFSLLKLKVDLPGHLSRLLSVPVAEDDALPPFNCRSCQAKAESIEQAAQIAKTCQEEI